MASTTNRVLTKLPAGPVDWVAVYNDMCDKLDEGFAMLLTAGEALAKGDPIYIKTDGKAWKADNTTKCRGVWKSTSTNASAEGYCSFYGPMTFGSGWTIGGDIYVDASKALSQTPESGDSRPVGYALSATKIFIYFVSA